MRELVSACAVVHGLLVAGRHTAMWREAVVVVGVVQKVWGGEGLVDDIHAGGSPQTQLGRRRACVYACVRDGGE